MKKTSKLILACGFKYFLFSSPIWGRFPIWLIFFKWGWNHQNSNEMSMKRLPSRELTYPPKNGILKMIFLFPRWGYVNFLEGTRFPLKVPGVKPSSIFLASPWGQRRNPEAWGKIDTPVFWSWKSYGTWWFRNPKANHLKYIYIYNLVFNEINITYQECVVFFLARDCEGTILATVFFGKNIWWLGHILKNMTVY